MVRTRWKNLVHDFTTRCDNAVGGVSITPDRARAAFFSDAYLDGGKTPIVRCGTEARFQTVAQINRPEVRVIVNPGGTNEQFVRANLAREIVVVHQDNNTIHQEFAAGHADLMITGSAEAGVIGCSMTLRYPGASAARTRCAYDGSGTPV